MNDDHKIKITLDDVARVSNGSGPVSTSAYTGPVTPPSGEKNYGTINNPNCLGSSIGTQSTGPVYMKAWFYLGVAGMIGTFLAWAVCEPSFIDGRTEQYGWGNIMMFPLLIILMSLGFGIADSIVEHSLEKALSRGLLSLLIGIPGGFIFSYIANVLYNIELQIASQIIELTQANPIFWIVRGVAWAVFGIAGGLVYGLVGKSGKKCKYGILGGILGAGIGGVIFDPIALITQTGSISRWFGMMIFGAATGASMGLVENALKSRWLFVTTGPLAGKQFIIYKPITRIGNQQGSDIYLFKDPSILPGHATIELRGSRLWLITTGPVLVNGQASQQQALNNGDMMTIGRYSFAYQEKNK
jgi:hypothetical protein